jgi:UPF0716 family protein affecting phage T7 exclusion
MTDVIPFLFTHPVVRSTCVRCLHVMSVSKREGERRVEAAAAAATEEAGHTHTHTHTEQKKKKNNNPLPFPKATSGVES